MLSRIRRLGGNCVAHALGTRARARHRIIHSQREASTTASRVVILGIETSCDDTAAAVISDEGHVLGEAITKQDAVHAQYKGIVPALAAQAHEANIENTINLALSRSGIQPENLTAVAVTRGPGLALCLKVGVKAAQNLALQSKLPLILVNHMEGHALVPRMGDSSLQFPYLALLISGGHTQILVCRGVGEFSLLGETLDDAVGDAFDRTATLLDLDYDGGGGKALERIAREGKVVYNFPVALLSVKNCDFSFSGLKTSVRTTIKSMPSISNQDKANIAASFQDAVARHLENKLKRAVQWCRLNVPEISHLVLSGGVACNSYLRERLGAFAAVHGLELKAPPPKLCTDNGIMIAWAGLESWKLGKNILVGENVGEPIRYIPRWPLDQSGVDYFPGSHRSHKKDELELRISQAASRIDSGDAEARHYFRAAKNSAHLGRYEEAVNFNREGLVKFPDHPHLQKQANRLAEEKKSHDNKFQ